MKDGFLFCQLLKTSSQAREVYIIVKEFFKKHRQDWFYMHWWGTSHAGQTFMVCCIAEKREFLIWKLHTAFFISTLLQHQHCPPNWRKLEICVRLWTWSVAVLWITNCFNCFVRRWVSNTARFCIIRKWGGCHIVVCFTFCLNCGMKLSSFSTSRDINLYALEKSPAANWACKERKHRKFSFTWRHSRCFPASRPCIKCCWTFAIAVQ